MKRLALLSALAAALICPAARAESPEDRVGEGVPKFNVRPGYKVTLASEAMQEARFIEFDDKGTLYLAQPKAGQILSMRDEDNDGVFETTATFVSGKPTAHGMCFHDGWLWFSQSGSIHKARDADGDGVADETVAVIPDGQLPAGGGHWWRALLVTDRGIFTSIGDAQNLSDQSQTDRQKIWFFNHDGTGKRLWSTGVRNTEKLRQRPGTTELWGADHNSDNFGALYGEDPKRGKQPFTDVLPPCEWNHYVEGGFYGHPFLVGNRIPRPEFLKKEDLLDLAAKCIPPAYELGAHTAPNGWCFITKDAFPGHKGDALVAMHGSWNSVKKVGYGVARVLYDPETGKPYGMLNVVTCLTADGKTVLARPVDCAEAPDGSVLFSCDQTKKIYRISKAGERTASAN